jgi:DNA primase
MQRLVDTSVPFVRFRVERELSTGDVVSAEGKDAVIGALRPVFAQIGPSALREELVALVADRTDLSPAMVGSWLAQGPGRGAGRADSGRGEGSRGGGGEGAGAGGESAAAVARPGALDTAARAERDFLVQCLALPSPGADALRAVDPEQAFTNPLMRRAASHLVEHLDAPAEGVAPDDGELAALMAQLAVRAAQQRGSTAALEGARLNLEILAVGRDKVAARAEGRPVAPLMARERGLVDERNRAIEQAMAEQPAS